MLWKKSHIQFVTFLNFRNEFPHRHVALTFPTLNTGSSYYENVKTALFI